MRIIKLFVSLLAILIVSLGARLSQAGPGQQQPRRALEFVPYSAPLETRAGTDDGAAFAIQFAGSTHGSLEPCG